MSGSKWFERRYYAWVLLGDGPPRLFEERGWQVVHPRLRSLFALSSEKPGVQTAQVNAVTGRPIKFGRLTWKSTPAAPWLVPDGDTSRRFLTTQLWCPSLKECNRRRVAPDLFVEIRGFAAPAFSQGFFLAAAEEVANSHESREVILAVLRGVLGVLQPLTLAAATQSSWGQPLAGGIGHTNALADFMAHGFPTHTDRITLSELRGDWQQLQLPEAKGP